MDSVDTAQYYEDIHTQVSITKARKPLVISNPHKVCWFCGEPTDDKRRWCDAVCRDCWETKQ